MLSPEYLRDAPEPMVRLYNQVADDILADMAKRIAAYDGVGSTAEYRMRRIRDMGYLQEDIIKRLSSITGRSMDEIREIIKDAGIRTLKSDDVVYRGAGLSPAPVDASQILQDILLTGMEQTGQLFTNLTRTTAGTATKQFEEALDRAWLQVESGAFSHTEATRIAIKDLCSKGLQYITYPSGRTISMEAAVRRALLTGINQTAARLQEARADEMGCDLVEVSAHAGARTGIGVGNHAEWQGKIYSRSGLHQKYPDFKEKTGYGTGPGLCGWGCRHSFSPYFEGAPRAYTEEMLKEYNAKKYVYNGEKLTEEEASKIQRYHERQIRRWKREYKAMSAAGLPTGEAAAKISVWEARQKDFLQQTGLKPASGRTDVGAYTELKKKETSITRELRSIGFRGTIYVTPKKLDVGKLTFDDAHINSERAHGVTRQEATSYIQNAKISISAWNGQRMHYYSEAGTAYVDVVKNEIRTAFKSGEYDEKIKALMEVVNKYE